MISKREGSLCKTLEELSGRLDNLSYHISEIDRNRCLLTIAVEMIQANLLPDHPMVNRLEVLVEQFSSVLDGDLGQIQVDLSRAEQLLAQAEKFPKA